MFIGHFERRSRFAGSEPELWNGGGEVVEEERHARRVLPAREERVQRDAPVKPRGTHVLEAARGDVVGDRVPREYGEADTPHDEGAHGPRVVRERAA